MNQTASAGKAKGFLEQVVRWAEGQPNILAVALVGSYARVRATATSDLDLVLIATAPDKLLEHPAWIERFGEVRRMQVEPYDLLTALRAWYQDWLEVEFGLTSRAWASQPLDSGTRQVIEGGLRVLYERENLLSRLIDDEPGKGQPT